MFHHTRSIASGVASRLGIIAQASRNDSGTLKSARRENMKKHIIALKIKLGIVYKYLAEEYDK